MIDCQNMVGQWITLCCLLLDAFQQAAFLQQAQSMKSSISVLQTVLLAFFTQAYTPTHIVRPTCFVLPLTHFLTLLNRHIPVYHFYFALSTEAVRPFCIPSLDISLR